MKILSNDSNNLNLRLSSIHTDYLRLLNTSRDAEVGIEKKIE